VASRAAAPTITLERVRQAHTIAEPVRCETLHLTSTADAAPFRSPESSAAADRRGGHAKRQNRAVERRPSRIEVDDPVMEHRRFRPAWDAGAS
jgi:hypothetical protein